LKSKSAVLRWHASVAHSTNEFEDEKNSFIIIVALALMTGGIWGIYKSYIRVNNAEVAELIIITATIIIVLAGLSFVL
jgi:hypothetical protein